MKDILPEEAVKWQYIENRARSVFERYSYREIRTPVLEETSLFTRSIGEATDIVQKEKWRAAAAGMADLISTGVIRLILRSVFWLFGKGMFGSPDSPSDGLVEIEAEDKHNFKEHLADIEAHTLVIGGEKDFLYPIRETAEGIPNARLILYKGAGHGAMMKRQFAEDVLSFLKDDIV